MKLESQNNDLLVAHQVQFTSSDCLVCSHSAFLQMQELLQTLLSVSSAGWVDIGRVAVLIAWIWRMNSFVVESLMSWRGFIKDRLDVLIVSCGFSKSCEMVTSVLRATGFVVNWNFITPNRLPKCKSTL